MDHGNLETMISSNAGQRALPDLDSPLSEVKFVQLNQQAPLTYPRTPEDVRENLLAIAFGLCKHEKRADIWKSKACIYNFSFAVSEVC
jgi:hypothetical protein